MGNRRKTIEFAVYLMICGLILLFFRKDPSGPVPGFPPCRFHQLTGFHCATCGITRALRAAAQGNLILSLRSNLLLFPAFFLFGYWILFPDWLTWRKFFLGVIPALVLYMILRNLPFYPFPLLLPPE